MQNCFKYQELESLNRNIDSQNLVLHWNGVTSPFIFIKFVLAKVHFHPFFFLFFLSLYIFINLKEMHTDYKKNSNPF